MKYIFVDLNLPTTSKEIYNFNDLLKFYSEKNTKILYGNEEAYYNFLRSNKNAKAIYIHIKERI